MNVVDCIANALRKSACKKSVLPYARLHALTPQGMSLDKRYEHLEAAICSIHDPTECDYGALMALDCGLPGPDFFLRLRRLRYADYVSSFGDPRYARVTRKKKHEVVEIERARVYVHALTAKDMQFYARCEVGLL